MTTDPDVRFGSIDIEFQVEIAAPRERVWQGLTTEIGQWWHRSFYAGKNAKDYVCEARVGGRVFEDWGGCQGLLWANVISVQENELLQTAGELFPEYGGPGRVMNTYRLAVKGTGTILTFQETVLGRVTPKLRADLETGWKFLYGECLKPYVETGTAIVKPFDGECG